MHDEIANLVKMHFNQSMDAVSESPPAHEQVITQKLLACGLSKSGLSVSYQDELQSYEIVISPTANATPEMFACIRDAVSSESVTFEDPELTKAYFDFVSEALRPQIIASAETALAELGLLKGLPRRADFASDTLFAAALEEHCGLTKGEVIRPFGGMLVLQPPIDSHPDFASAAKRYACLLSAMTLAGARGDIKFGFVGNQAVAPPY